MGDLNRQQLCAALSISESTVRRQEKIGLRIAQNGYGLHWNYTEATATPRVPFLP